jgi:hypothetical protein
MTTRVARDIAQVSKLGPLTEKQKELLYFMLTADFLAGMS